MDKMPNSETLEVLMRRIEHEEMNISYSKNEKRIMKELARVRTVDYDQHLIYLIRHGNLRRAFRAEFYS